MNIEIANRLVNMRKSHNLSQEALAEKLGISRQAVSKWERAEASPDTDNLILLARLYGVSLDDLLQTDDEIPKVEPSNDGFDNTRNDNMSNHSSDYSNNYSSDYTEQGTYGDGASSDSDSDYVHVGFRGIHVKGKDGEVHVGWDGIHVDDRGNGDKVHIDKKGIYVNGEKYDKDYFAHHAHFPVALIVAIVYVVIGCIWGAWHPGWLLFFVIPIWYSLVEAIEKKNAHHFAYPVLATLIFLCLGIFGFLWHPGWVIFLTVPLYYSFVAYFQGNRKRYVKENQGWTEDTTEEGGAFHEE